MGYAFAALRCPWLLATCARMRAWPVDWLLGTRDVRARNCVPVLKLFISPTTADPRHRTDRPATTGASPSGMIMHRSASHYTYTQPVYPLPILPTRYVDYTTSRSLFSLPPQFSMFLSTVLLHSLISPSFVLYSLLPSFTIDAYVDATIACFALHCIDI